MIRREGFCLGVFTVLALSLGTLPASEKIAALTAKIAELETRPEGAERALALAEVLVQRSKEKHDAGEFDSAFKDLDRAMKLGIVGPNAFTMRGRILADMGDGPAAAQAFNLALEEDPNHHPALAARARFALQTSHYDVAIADATKLIDAGKRFHFLRGSAFHYIRNYPDALADFTTDIERGLKEGDAADDIGTAREMRVETMLKLGAHALALEELVTAKREFDKDGGPGVPPVFYRSRAAAYSGLEQFANAAVDLGMALKLAEENHAAILLERAQAHAANKDYPAANADIAAAKKKAPGDPDIQAFVQKAERAMESLQAGGEDGRKEEKIGKPSEKQVAESVRSIEAAIAAGNFEGAMRTIEMLDVFGHPDVPRMRGKVFALAGQHGRALGFLSEALRGANKDDAHLIGARANTLVRLGVYDIALREFERAYALGLAAPGSREFYGMVLVHYERYQEAIAALDFEEKWGSENPSVWINRGSAYEKLGQDEKALADYRKAGTLAAEGSALWDAAKFFAGEAEKRLKSK